MFLYSQYVCKRKVCPEYAFVSEEIEHREIWMVDEFVDMSPIDRTRSENRFDLHEQILNATILILCIENSWIQNKLLLLQLIALD